MSQQTFIEWPIAMLHGKVNKLTDLQCLLLSSILVEGENFKKQDKKPIPQKLFLLYKLILTGNLSNERFDQ